MGTLDKAVATGGISVWQYATAAVLLVIISSAGIENTMFG